MTKRAEWMRRQSTQSAYKLTVGTISIFVDLYSDGYWYWRPVGASGGPDSFPTLALAQADAVRWLRATIAEMAAACPEVE